MKNKKSNPVIRAMILGILLGTYVGFDAAFFIFKTEDFLALLHTPMGIAIHIAILLFFFMAVFVLVQYKIVNKED